MRIKLLDEHLINKIAAGEVIERPASVVKELVENAIDAAAGKIEVTVVEGGLKSMVIEDDGEGMSGEEIPLAFQRHATSKIRETTDLYNIRSLGFRGEALPSIAAVSRIEIHSKTAHTHGSRALLEGGTLLENRPHPVPQGTRIMVQDLFFNTPARKKFLKTTVTENNQVYTTMARLALSRPDISFSFQNEKKLYFKTPGNGSLLDAIATVFGKELSRSLIEVQYRGDGLAISGYISALDYKRGNRNQQLFFVNRRAIRSPVLYRAVDEAYKELLMGKEYPAVILFLEHPAGELDVNVHPQKSEIKFRDDRFIFRALSGTLKQALQQRYFLKQPQPPVDYEYRSAWRRPGVKPAPPPVPARRQHDLWEPGEIGEGAAPRRGPGRIRVIGQVFDSYIVLEREGEMWLVDQHAAHEKILYSRFRQQQQPGEVQELALPLTLELSLHDAEILQKEEALLQGLGFHIDAWDGGTIIIRSTPLLARGQERALLMEMLEYIKSGRTPDLDLAREAMILNACKRAVRSGDNMSREEMEALIDDLLALEEYEHCPHGRPMIYKIERQSLEKKLRRT